MSTPPVPRQQRRKLRRDLIERGRKALRQGMPLPPDSEDAKAIALALYDELADGTPADRASRLAQAAEDMLDRTMARQIKGLAIACRKGCSHCCWQRVTCTAPEILRVAQWLGANAGRPGVPAIEAVVAADRLPIPGAVSGPAGRRPCALLLDHACGIHPGRPISCRAVLSMSATACEKAMTDPANADPVPLVVGTMDTAEAVRTLMLAAVTAKGLPDCGYDLIEGLAAVHAAPGAEARWLAGEDIFKGVRQAPRPPAARQLQDQLAAAILALAD